MKKFIPTLFATVFCAITGLSGMEGEQPDSSAFCEMSPSPKDVEIYGDFDYWEKHPPSFIDPTPHHHLKKIALIEAHKSNPTGDVSKLSKTTYYEWLRTTRRRYKAKVDDETTDIPSLWQRYKEYGTSPRYPHNFSLQKEVTGDRVTLDVVFEGFDQPILRYEATGPFDLKRIDDVERTLKEKIDLFNIVSEKNYFIDCLYHNREVAGYFMENESSDDADDEDDETASMKCIFATIALAEALANEKPEESLDTQVPDDTRCMHESFTTYDAMRGVERTYHNEWRN